jgi:hypothetical protein
VGFSGVWRSVDRTKNKAVVTNGFGHTEFVVASGKVMKRAGVDVPIRNNPIWALSGNPGVVHFDPGLLWGASLGIARLPHND